jgi:hypothetical protein
MTFPVGPTNGEKANVNGVTYTYNSTLTAWTVSSNFLDGISANLVAANNITSSNTVVVGTTVSATGNITGGNVITSGLISAAGNITGGNLIGTIRTAAQTSITSVGTLSALSVTGNITGGNVSTSGSITSAALVLNNGSADGGGLVLKSLGFTDWEIDQNSGNIRFFQPGVSYMQLATTGLSVTGNITSTTNLVGFVRPSAGTTSAAPVLLTAGTNLTTPAAGAVEFDGSVLYATEATTPGRGEVGVFQQFRYTSAGSALGPAIADFFGANSSMNLAAGSIYEIEAWLYFLKTTAGTATFTWAFSSAVEVAHSIYEGTAAAGFNTTAVTTAPVTGQVVQRTSTTMAHAATGSLTTAVYQSYRFRLRLRTTLATNARLRITSSAGSATPQPGSYYTVRQISANTGNFAA